MNFLNTFKNGLANIGVKFLSILIPTAKAALSDVVSIAGAAVIAEASKTISGQEKFGNAVQNVINTVKAQGKVVAVSTAQVAVQAAYEALIGSKK